MAQKKIRVTIEGTTPLLMHRYPMEPIEGFEKKPKEEQAEIAAYRDEETKQLYIPGVNIMAAMISGGKYGKGKGRGTLKRTVAASILITPEICDLGTKVYKIDSRAVVVRATGGRIVRHRPRLEHWKCTFYVEYDDVLMTEQQLRAVVDSTGNFVGLLDFRPERNGPFGRFMVVEWEKA